MRRKNADVAQWLTFLTPVALTWYIMVPLLRDTDLPLWAIGLFVAATPVVWFIFFLGLSYRYWFWGQVGDNRWMIILQGTRLVDIVLNSTLYKFKGGDGVQSWKLESLGINSTATTAAGNIFERFGMYWIGIPGLYSAKKNLIVTRRIVQQVNENGEELDSVPEQCESIEQAPSIFFLHAWETEEVQTRAPERSAKAEAAEEKSGLTQRSGKFYVDVTNQGHFLVDNPYVFSYGSEPEEVIRKVEPMIIATDGQIIRRMTFDELSLEGSEGAQEKLNDEQLNAKNEEELNYGQRLRRMLNMDRSLPRYGVRLLDIDFISVQPTDQATEEAVRNIERARLKAEADAEEGKGIAAKKREIGKGEADAERSILTARADGMRSLVSAANGSEAILTSHFQSEGMKVAAGEGEKGTRPDVISFGGNTGGFTPTVDVGRYSKRSTTPPSEGGGAERKEEGGNKERRQRRRRPEHKDQQ